jgi:hypothetical protein
MRGGLGMEAGGTFVASVEEAAIRLVPLRDVIRRVQISVRRHVPAEVELVSELSADRRAEDARE